MSEYETINAEVGNGIGVLTMNRPESLIAVNEKMAFEIQSVLKNFSRDKDVRCVAITGCGRAFSAGQDLKEISEGTSFSDLFKCRYNPTIILIAEMQKPVAALINGVAAGAGMSISLACDFEIMSESAKLVQVFSRIGLVPDSGASFFLPGLVGRSKAFELAALDGELSADEALKLGIVNCVFHDEKFLDESMKILGQFANGPTKAYSLIKKMLNHSSGASIEESLEYEVYLQEIASRTADAREGIKAFVEKRPPSFRGK